MADDKIADAKANGANMILAAIWAACAFGRKAVAQGETMSVRHAAEVLPHGRIRRQSAGAIVSWFRSSLNHRYRALAKLRTENDTRSNNC